MLIQSQATSSDSAELKKPDIQELNSNYLDADSVDQEVFAEMRSNVLIVSGDHYNKRQNKFYRKIRDSKELSSEQKLRLVKNHTQKICKIYANNILAPNPGVGFMPKDESSMHDQKVAEMHHAVWQDAMEKYFLSDKMDDWCDSFVQIGEVAVKLFFDPDLGNHTGYEPMIDEETGEPMIDPETGEQVADESKPVNEGLFVFEEIYGFNLLRPPECKDMRQAEWLGIRKMTDRNELLRRFKGNEEIRAKITSDQDETYMVFDSLNGGYKKSTKQTMIREYYYRPSRLFPKGYFYITTKEGILTEGELPGGLFPIIFAAFDKVQTTPRGRGPVKIMRPYQAEINRASSKIAEHQITLGDDKLLIQNGTKASAGASLPGVRTINYTGMKPEVLQGRAGDQYLAYLNSQITEMYQVLMVAEDSEENQTNLDPMVLLYRSARQKMKFQRYIKRFEGFLIELVKLYLKLAKIHLADDAVIMAVGKNEQVNIPEFRQYDDLCYEVKVEAQSQDVDEKFGKQMVLQHSLQYVGSKLEREDIGKIMRQMPYANDDESFEDFTIDFDTALNDMLALDRGEKPPINQYDPHPYLIKKLTSRTRKPDFKYLSPQIQQNYFNKIKLHQDFEAKKQLEIQRANQGLIPTGGALIAVDFYVDAPNSTGGMKQQKAKIPYQSIDWLIKQMEAQGASQAEMQSMGDSGVQAEVSNRMMELQGMPPSMPSMNASPVGGENNPMFSQGNGNALAM